MKNDMNNITIIIPIINFKENYSLFNKAVNSIVGVPYSNVIAIYGTEDEEYVKKYKNENGISFLLNTGKTDFCSQINFGVSSCNTEFFSILEIDDEYSKNWFSNVEKYITERPDIDIYTPIVELRDFKDEGKMFSFANEIVWANSFSNEIGIIDYDCLENFYDFNMTGSVFRKNEFISLGGLKPSIKISFFYEFLLRASSKGLKIYVIPKIGYYHYVNRDGSLIDLYQKEITEEEAKEWYNLAKIEYSYKEDRNKLPVASSDEIKELK